MTTRPFNLTTADTSWQTCLEMGLSAMDSNYLSQLASLPEWLPGPDKIFSAFSLPVKQVNYVLFGESPYPRKASANGYAFWDNAVDQLWSDTGLSKTVNRATSLRNILKMLLIAEEMLTKTDTSQAAIANLDKNHLVQKNDEFFSNFIDNGFLLLNATPVLQTSSPQKDARSWKPFIRSLLSFLAKERPDVKLLLLGNIAKEIDKLSADLPLARFYAEHPYNLSFITNPEVLGFFSPLHLLQKRA